FQLRLIDHPNLNALELRKFWKGILDEFHQRFICDYNLVEWERLIKLIRNNIFDNQADAVVDELLLSRLNEKLHPADEATKQPSRDINVEDAAYQFSRDILFGTSGAEHRVKDDLADENEYTFIIKYFSKIPTTVCDLKKDDAWKFKWGESKLAASKEEENLGKNDDNNGAVGSFIDGIIASKGFNLEFFLLEVSGPMQKEDYNHFFKERLKIAS
ncbi:hypothetical protein CU098_005932, partial [Rhizopus stolonifer]